MDFRGNRDDDGSQQMDAVLGSFDKIKNLSVNILSEIKTHGYAYIKQPLSLDDFELISGQLGMIKGRADIKIDKTQEIAQQRARKVKNRPSAYQAETFAFHQDNPTADMFAWYCREQDDTDGTMLLLDTGDVGDYFSAEDLAVMSSVNIRYSLRVKDNEEFSVRPLVLRKDSTYNVYYQPWLLLDSYDTEQSLALEKFSEYLKHKEKTQLISVPIKRGECLFIDNHRILHGRNAIADNSKRHLIRLMIVKREGA